MLLALFLLGCSHQDFTVEVSLDPDMPSWVHLSFTSEEPGTVDVTYGTAQGDVEYHLSSDESTTEHELELRGLPFLAKSTYRVVLHGEDGEDYESEGDFTTGGMPAELSDFRLESSNPDHLPANFLLGTLSSDAGAGGALYAVDREGRWVWYIDQGPGVQSVELEWDGSSIWFNRFSTDHTVDEGVVVRTTLDGSDREEIRTELAHHAFCRLPDGGIAWVAIDVRDWYDEDLGREIPVVGDQVMVREPEGDGWGEPYTLFSTWDWAEPVKTDHWDGGFYTQGKDWTHANSLYCSTERNTALMAFRNLDTVLELDLETGEVLRQFGGEGGYGFAEGSIPFEYPHDPRWTEEGNLRLLSTGDGLTRIRVYRVDDEARELEELETWGESSNFRVLAQGSALDFGEGLLVSWGTSGVLQALDAGDQPYWTLSAPAGSIFGDAVPLDTLGP